MLKIKSSYYDPVERYLIDYFFNNYYKPLLKTYKKWIPEKTVLKNSISDLINAIKTGQIYYRNKEFTGSFNSRISRELRKFADWDARSKSFKVKSVSNIPPNVNAEIVRRGFLNSDIEKELEKQISEIESEDLIELQTPIEGPILDMEKQLNKDLSSLGVNLQLNDEQRKKLVDDYNLNQKLNIKNWDSDQIQRLRDMVMKIQEAGYNQKTLSQLIEKEWEVSKNKAKFLARQETSLFLAKFRREQSLDVGINKYKWSTSRDERTRKDHKELNGKIFFYGDPPIVDKKTGRRAEPGEDFNCRCVAIPVLE